MRCNEPEELMIGESSDELCCCLFYGARLRVCCKEEERERGENEW